MNLYDLLKEIIQTKKGTANKEHTFNDAFTSPFLMQRWLSMDTPLTASIINITSNKLYKGLDDDKNLWYKLFIVLNNKKTYKKIAYIKKEAKTENKTESKMIEKLSERNELSKHEVENNLKLLEALGKDTKKYKKLVNE